MKKERFFGAKLLSLLLILASGLTFTACGDDDDDNNGQGGNGGGAVNWGQFSTKLPTPTYENVSAKYEVSTDNSENISSIELTASGNYIVAFGKSDQWARSTEPAADSKQQRFLGMKAKIAKTRAAYYDKVVEGKFVKENDNTFRLEGWGTVTVLENNGNAYSLIITLANGTRLPTLTAKKTTQMADNEKTNFLCRTWTFSSLRMILVVGGKTMYDKEYPITQLENFGADMYEMAKNITPDDVDDLEDYLDEWEDEEEDVPTGVIFTKSGTYMPLYKNSSLAISTWAWENIDTGLMRYSWNYDNMYDPNESGNVKVGSRGQQLMISESFSDRDSKYEEEELEGYSATMVYYLNEAK